MRAAEQNFCAASVKFRSALFSARHSDGQIDNLSDFELFLQGLFLRRRILMRIGRRKKPDDTQMSDSE